MPLDQVDPTASVTVRHAADADTLLTPELVAAWDALADATGAAPFTRPGWIATWWRAFGAGELELRLLHRGDRLAGVLPLVRDGGHRRSVTNGETSDFSPLAADRTAADILLTGAATEGDRLSLAWLEQADWEAAAAAATRAGAPVLVDFMARSPWIDLENPGERPRTRFLRELRRRRRRLARSGALEVDLRREATPALLDEGFALEAAGWKGERGTAVAQNPASRRFYGDLADWAGSRDMLRLLFLRLDGHAIAFSLNLVDGDRLFGLKVGFDAGHASDSPGQLLMADALDLAREENLRAFELLGADEGYKLEWTDRVRERRWVEIYRPTAVGRLTRAAVLQRAGWLAAHPDARRRLKAARDETVRPALARLRRRGRA